MNSSGPISLGGFTLGQSIALELGQSPIAQISFNDANVRTLGGDTTAGSPVQMPTDFYGKSFSNFSPFSPYTFTVPGVYSGGGGPHGSPGSLQYSSQTVTVPGSVAVTLGIYVADSTSGFSSPYDAVFISPNSNWTSIDLQTLGINLANVQTIGSNVTVNVSVTADIDREGWAGWCVLTRPGIVSFSNWSSLNTTNSQVIGASDPAGGRHTHYIGSFNLPVPGINDLIVLSFSDDSGSDSWVYTLTG
jgi:hypothetical protein